MGGCVGRHSSHSFGTPLQPAHTSDLLGGYKRRWGTLKEGEQALDISASLSCCCDLLFHRKIILLKRDCLNFWRCMKSLHSWSSAFHWWGNHHFSLSCLFNCCKMTTSGSKLLIRNVWFCVWSQVSASCPKDCRCPSELPRCAAGISLMLDDCGCCKVCARQLFEDCSKTEPCDRTKGLECNFGGGYGSARGICRGTVTSVLLWVFFLTNYSLCPICNFHLKTHFFPFSLKQLNLMEERVSTTTRFTRMGKPSNQIASTSALAWTVLLGVCPCAHMNSHCPTWVVPSQGWSKCRGDAVNNSFAQKKERRRVLWWRNTAKSTTKTDHLNMTSPWRMSQPLFGEEKWNLYLVSFFTGNPLCQRFFHTVN